MAVRVALLKFFSQEAVYVTAKVLAGITADLNERRRRNGRNRRTICLCCMQCVCGKTKDSSSNLKYELCQRAQSSVAKEDDVRHSVTKEMAICRREN